MKNSQSFTPEAPKRDEMLYAAVNGETNEVEYLVYSSRSGLYIRSSAGWFKLPPTDDTTLDNYVVVDVSPGFIPQYDKAEKEGKKLGENDIQLKAVEAPIAAMRGGK